MSSLSSTSHEYALVARLPYRRHRGYVDLSVNLQTRSLRSNLVFCPQLKSSTCRTSFLFWRYSFKHCLHLGKCSFQLRYSLVRPTFPVFLSHVIAARRWSRNLMGSFWCPWHFCLCSFSFLSCFPFWAFLRSVDLVLCCANADHFNSSPSCQRPTPSRLRIHAVNR